MSSSLPSLFPQARENGCPCCCEVCCKFLLFFLLPYYRDTGVIMHLRSTPAMLAAAVDVILFMFDAFYHRTLCAAANCPPLPPPPCHAVLIRQSGAPFAGFSGEWGATGISDALYTISNDMQRIQSLLPELSPQDRYYACLHHTSLWFPLLCMHIVSRLPGRRLGSQSQESPYVHCAVVY